MNEWDIVFGAETNDASLEEARAIIDVSQMPSQWAFLGPLVERWGIGDDILREHAVTKASSTELQDLIEKLKPWYRQLIELLGNFRDGLARLGDHYYLLTNLTMAFESAELELSR